MASIISAGTTSGTSLNLSGDTSGVLQLASNGSTTAVTIDTSQNVGIGTSSPSTKLHVEQSTTGDAFKVARGGNYIIMGGSGSGTQYVKGYEGVVAFGNEFAGSTTFLTNNTERMRIDSSGNVLIGLTSADISNNNFISKQSLDTTAGIAVINNNTGSSATAAMRYKNSGAAVAYTGIGSTGRSAYAGLGANVLSMYTDNAAGISLSVDAAGPMTFNTNSTERMRIDSSGNLLVGESTQRGRISVTTGSDESIFAINSAGASSATMCSWNNASSGNNYLHAFFVDAGASNVGNIDYNRAAGLVRYQTTSDATLKNIIGDSDGERSLEILNTTRIREFAWKNDVEQKPQIGVIAQELHETYKGAVSVGGENDKGEYRPWGVDKTAFTFHLIAGWQAHEKLIQEQQTLIENLTTRLNALEGK